MGCYVRFHDLSVSVGKYYIPISVSSVIIVMINSQMLHFYHVKYLYSRILSWSEDESDSSPFHHVGVHSQTALGFTDDLFHYQKRCSTLSTSEIHEMRLVVLIMLIFVNPRWILYTCF